MDKLSSRQCLLVLASFVAFNSIVVFVFTGSSIRPCMSSVTANNPAFRDRSTFKEATPLEDRDISTASATTWQTQFTLAQSKWSCENQTEVEARNLVCRHRLPALIGIGAKKSGTFALKFFLGIHPSIRIKTGEAHQWDKRVNRSIDEYCSRMPMSSQYQITMEKTPGYFVGNDIPAAIARDISPDVKLVLILRDPVKRAISDYVHVRELQLKKLVHRSRKEMDDGAADVESIESYAYANISYIIKDTFEQSVLTKDGRVNPENAIIFTGLYALHLRNWLKTFPLNQILILDGDLFTKNPLPQLREVEAFLGLPKYFDADKLYFNSTKGFFCVAVPIQQCAGEKKGRTHPDVDTDTLQKLYRYYEPHNKELEALIGRTFSWQKR